jgi:transcriptional regulator with XRE-family HTH domain
MENMALSQSLQRIITLIRREKTMETMTFGQMLQKRRAERGLALRNLERHYDVDAGRLCKIENGGLQPPVGEKALGELLKAYEFTERDPEYQTMLDLSAIETGRVPLDLSAALSDEELAKKAENDTPEEASHRHKNEKHRGMWLECFKIMREMMKHPKKFAKFVEFANQILME